jgi:hypothetical protein
MENKWLNVSGKTMESPGLHWNKIHLVVLRELGSCGCVFE